MGATGEKKAEKQDKFRLRVDYCYDKMNKTEERGRIL